ncbi:MAG: phosphatidylserine decarboxylase family protein [Chloroflexi bacterium]|nr:phosphatidylserine decarboxylase family protein [Chloroflexota bacterium]MCI0649455.1 phosphatidylserine decarboxylase family protein [Chloroflexota bacterium]MCI0730745.1 phosphatidylserine decarboxylase family protein [Chloroflexota bacterium]
MDKNRAWPFARGGEATILIFTALFGLAAVWWFARPGLWSGVAVFLAALLWLLILHFFRDPRRTVKAVEGLVVSPADGEVVTLVNEPEERYLQAAAVRISIFLAVTDVHVQRVPLSGRVESIEHRPGKFLQAFRPEASTVNESIAMVIATPYGRVLVKQIAGILARRCVNYAAVGQAVTAGERFGLIRFGSRVDLFLPPQAKLLVKVGDKVAGAVTPVAQLTEEIHGQ